MKLSNYLISKQKVNTRTDRETHLKFTGFEVMSVSAVHLKFYELKKYVNNTSELHFHSVGQQNVRHFAVFFKQKTKTEARINRD